MNNIDPVDKIINNVNAMLAKAKTPEDKIRIVNALLTKIESIEKFKKENDTKMEEMMDKTKEVLPRLEKLVDDFKNLSDSDE